MYFSFHINVIEPWTCLDGIYKRLYERLHNPGEFAYLICLNKTKRTSGSANNETKLLGLQLAIHVVLRPINTLPF